jgi:glycosyltransferase involved in cell wall biosynthesis
MDTGALSGEGLRPTKGRQRVCDPKAPLARTPRFETSRGSGSAGAPGHASAIRNRPRVPRVSVVIPALNEADNLPFVFPHIPPHVDEVLVVDGDSVDDTLAVARSLRPDVRLVRQTGRGKGAALRSGVAACAGDIIVLLDADGSTDPGEIPVFIGALLAGADVVKGSRFLQGGGTADMPWHRRLGNWALVRLVRLLFGSCYTDLCYGYVAFWADVGDALEFDADGFEIETLINIRALRAGLRVAEVPSFEYKRRHGRGHLRTIPDGWRVLKTIVSERTAADRTRARWQPNDLLPLAEEQ